MNDKKSVADSINVEENIPSDTEMDELRREMRSATLTAWIQDNQQSILAGVVALVLALIAGGLWIEQDRSTNESAATLYQQAMSEQETDKKLTLLENVTRDFSSSSYAALALMQLAGVDVEHAEKHLNAVTLHPKSMAAWVWQAHLDLAELKIEQGDMAAAQAHLDIHVGKQYQQLRYYLQALASTDADERNNQLKKALDAPSHDEALKRQIESLLSMQES